MEFNPPLPEPPRWATYIENRNPKFKIHKNLGHAKLALVSDPYDGRFCRPGILYEFTDGSWEARYTIEGKVRPLDHPLFREAALKKENRRHASLQRHFERRTADGTVTKDWLQGTCWYCGEPRWKIFGFNSCPDVYAVPSRIVQVVE